jgi:hypothetical protein
MRKPRERSAVSCVQILSTAYRDPPTLTIISLITPTSAGKVVPGDTCESSQIFTYPSKLATIPLRIAQINRILAYSYRFWSHCQRRMGQTGSPSRSNLVLSTVSKLLRVNRKTRAILGKQIQNGFFRSKGNSKLRIPLECNSIIISRG